LQSKCQIFEQVVSHSLEQRLASYWVSNGGLHTFLNDSFISNPPFFDRNFDGLLHHSYDSINRLCNTLSTKSLMIEFFDCEFNEALVPNLNFLVLVNTIPDKHHEWYISTFEINAQPNKVSLQKLNCTLQSGNHLLEPVRISPDDNDSLWDFWIDLITAEINQHRDTHDDPKIPNKI
jgi:hypothetical protein